MLSTTIDLWIWSLDEPVEAHTPSRSVLSRDEIVRADRFVFERDRHRFIRGREKLREILAQYLNTDPAELPFVYSRYGKPEIDPSWRAGAPYFNLSHSGAVAMLAVSRDTELGIDLEEIRPIEHEVANQFFSSVEQEALARFKGQDWITEFYRLWTLKEAFLKARGDGLHHPLDSFDIDFSLGVSRLVRLDGDQLAADNWTLHSFCPTPGFMGALAIAKGNVSFNLIEQHKP